MTTPLVWMPGGIGRLILDATGVGCAAVMVGAIDAVFWRPRGQLPRPAQQRLASGSILQLHAQSAPSAPLSVSIGGDG